MTTSERNKVDFPLPRVTMDRVVLERMRRYVDQCNTEISGFGFATVSGENVHIMDARVVKQDSVGGAHTDINQDALNALMNEWSDREGVLVWWHSHVNMAAFWSATDTSTIKSLGKNGMVVAVVMNKRHESRCAIAFKADLPFRKDPSVIMIDDIPMHATLDMPANVLAVWDQELKDSLPAPRQFPVMTSHSEWDAESGRFVYPVETGTGRTIGLGTGSFWDIKDCWDNANDAYQDIDWQHGCHWSSRHNKWVKSYKQRELEKKRKGAVFSDAGVGSPSAQQDSLIEARRAFALNDEDIITYLPITDEYELLCGIKVNADWYVKKSWDKDDPTLAALGTSGLSDADLQDLYEQIRREEALEHATN